MFVFDRASRKGTRESGQANNSPVSSGVGCVEGRGERVARENKTGDAGMKVVVCRKRPQAGKETNVWVMLRNKKE